MSERDLTEAYHAFGDDPWVKGGSFSAWTYASERCAEICAATQAQA
jgi:hypothetical protein